MVERRRIFFFVKISLIILGDFIGTGNSINVGNVNERIINGSNVTSSDVFPYYASVVGVTLGDTTLCGGSIISNDWILTAAECTMGSVKFSIGIGSIILRAPQITMTSEEVYRHDQFDSDTLSNNIALIKLPATLNFVDNIQSIRLAPRSIDNGQFLNNRATIAGFGRLSDTEFNLSLILQWTDVIIIPNVDCLRYFSSDKITDRNFCAYGHPSRESSPCVGDFGGPLIVHDDTGRPIQIGIISFISTDGCSFSQPSGYLVVSHYTSWISSITGLTFD